MAGGKLYNATAPTYKAPVAKKVKAYVKKALRGEKQLKRFETATFNPSTAVMAVGTGIIYNLSNPIPGDTNLTRDGNEIQPTQITVRWSPEFGTPVTGAGGYISAFYRIILFQDRDCQGVLPTVLELLTTSDIYSEYNINYLKRFKILSDFYTKNDIGTTQQFKVIKRKMNGTIHYRGTTGAIGDQGANSLFLFVMSDATVTELNNASAFFRLNTALTFTNK